LGSGIAGSLAEKYYNFKLVENCQASFHLQDLFGSNAGGKEKKLHPISECILISKYELLFCGLKLEKFIDFALENFGVDRFYDVVAHTSLQSFEDFASFVFC